MINGYRIGHEEPSLSSLEQRAILLDAQIKRKGFCCDFQKFNEIEGFMKEVGYEQVYHCHLIRWPTHGFCLTYFARDNTLTLLARYNEGKCDADIENPLNHVDDPFYNADNGYIVSCSAYVCVEAKDIIRELRSMWWNPKRTFHIIDMKSLEQREELFKKFVERAQFKGENALIAAIKN